MKYATVVRWSFFIKGTKKLKKILYIYNIHYICICRCLRWSEAADTKAKEPQLLLADPDNPCHGEERWSFANSPFGRARHRVLKCVHASWGSKWLKTAKKSAHSVVDNISDMEQHVWWSLYSCGASIPLLSFAVNHQTCFVCKICFVIITISIHFLAAHEYIGQQINQGSSANMSNMFWTYKISPDNHSSCD